MIVGLLLALAQAHGARATLAQVEVNGPCTTLSLELEGAGRAQLDLGVPLIAGELRTLTLAVPLPSEALPEGVWSRALADAFGKTGQARLVTLESPIELREVPAELSARPRPAPEARAARLPWSVLFVLGAAFATTLSQRRRVWILGAIALLAGSTVFALILGVRSAVTAELVIIEARFDAPREQPWLFVRACKGSLEPADLLISRIEVEPRRSSVACLTRGVPPLVSLESAGATFFQLRAFDQGTRRLSREVNAFGAFDAAWLREADGPWSRLGPWPLGEALPHGNPGEPPGWLVPALPMGTSIFVGLLANENAELVSTGVPTWVRGLGL